MSILIKNGIFVTMAKEKNILMNGAVYIEEDKIIDVGESEIIEQKYKNKELKRIINAKHKVIFPGFINLHSHGTLLILRGQAEDENSYRAVYGKMFPIGEIMSGEDFYHMAKLAYVELLKFGSTTIVDNHGSIFDLGKAALETGIRAYLNEVIRDVDAVKIKDDGIYEYDTSIGEKFLKNSIEFIEKWHMRANGRIRGIMVAHAPDTCSPDLLKKIAETANKYKLGITLHLAQNQKEVAQVEKKYNKTLVQYLESTGVLGPLFIAAHGIFLEEGDIEILAKYKANVSHNPVINSKRGKPRIAPVLEMMKAGVNVGLGTDNMASDIIECMRVGQMIYRIRNKIPDEPKPEKMLEMATVNGAKALGREKEMGTIEKNKLADLIMVDYNRTNYTPLFEENVISNLVHTGLASDIDTVLVGGEILVENGKYIKEDEQEIIDNAQKAADRIWGKWRQIQK